MGGEGRAEVIIDIAVPCSGRVFGYGNRVTGAVWKYVDGVGDRGFSSSYRLFEGVEAGLSRDRAFCYAGWWRFRPVVFVVVPMIVLGAEQGCCSGAWANGCRRSEVPPV